MSPETEALWRETAPRLRAWLQASAERRRLRAELRKDTISRLRQWLERRPLERWQEHERCRMRELLCSGSDPSIPREQVPPPRAVESFWRLHELARDKRLFGAWRKA